MKARMVIAIGTGLCLVALFALGWAGDSGPVMSSNNPKGLTVKVAGVEKVTSPQAISAPVEIHEGLDARPDPEFTYTLSGRQGGEDIASALVIPGMPFVDTGTTVGYQNDYSESCDGLNFSTAPDVVFEYTPSIDELVDIVLCNSSYSTRLWVYETDETTMVACNRFNSNECSLPRSALIEVPMDSGLTYYIVVDGDYQLTPNSGQYILEMDAIEAPQPTDSVQRHPGFADNGNGSLGLGFEFNNGLDSVLQWNGSPDDGATFPTAGGFTVTGGGLATYPSLAYWMNDTSFVGTQTAPASESNGARTYLTRLNNINNNATWGQSSWDWSSYGWHDMRMADIASASTLEFQTRPGEFRFGVISMVHSSTYGGADPVGDDAPHLFYEIDTVAAGFATISWYNDLNGCRSTMVAVDPLSTYSYAIYDRWNETDLQWELFVRFDWLTDLDDPDSSGGYTYAMDPGDTIGYPAVAAYDGHLLIAAEYAASASPSDHDIIVLLDPDSNGTAEALVQFPVVATTDDERYPRISHITGDNFVISYVANNQLYLTVSTDGGYTWDTPYVISDADYVVNEYRSADIAEGGQKVIYEYQPGLPGDTSIFLRLAETNVIQDSDGDGIADEEDNCPAIANAGQEDADGDLVGDVCDDCTDTDGDGFGNPGYAANTCPEDNCPDDANPGQEDTDSDGVGDACCCVGITGNADGLGEINVQDLTFMVNYLFKSGPTPPCPNEGDVNGDTRINVNDLTYLVNYLFKQGPAPLSCP